MLRTRGLALPLRRDTRPPRGRALSRIGPKIATPCPQAVDISDRLSTGPKTFLPGGRLFLHCESAPGPRIAAGEITAERDHEEDGMSQSNYITLTGLVTAEPTLGFT